MGCRARLLPSLVIPIIVFSLVPPSVRAEESPEAKDIPAKSPETDDRFTEAQEEDLSQLRAVEKVLPDAPNHKDFVEYAELKRDGDFTGTFIDYKLKVTRKQKIGGIVLTASGSVCLAASAAFSFAFAASMSNCDEDCYGAEFIMIPAAINLVVGLPLLIPGIVKLVRSKRAKEALFSLGSGAAEQSRFTIGPWASARNQSGGLVAVFQF